jgi:hypothetical protein
MKKAGEYGGFSSIRYLDLLAGKSNEYKRIKKTGRLTIVVVPILRFFFQQTPFENSKTFFFETWFFIHKLTSEFDMANIVPSSGCC